MAKAQTTTTPRTAPTGKIAGFAEQIWKTLLLTVYRDAALDVFKTAGERDAIEDRTALFEDVQHHLEERASFTLATTALDALVQLALVNGEIGDYIVVKEEEKAYEKGARAAKRALYSVVRWIEKTHGVKDRPAVFDFYMRDDLDPWRELEKLN